MTSNNIKNDIAYLSGKMKKRDYLKEDKVDTERFQMMLLSRVANDIDSFIRAMEYLNKDFFEKKPQIQSVVPNYYSEDRFKDVSDDERSKVKEMVHKLYKDKIKLISNSIDKIFGGKEIEDDEESDEESDEEYEDEDEDEE